MQTFTTVTGIAAPFLRANVDTDVIMPKQFLKGIVREDLAKGVFHDLRFDAAGAMRPEFVLNRPGYRDAAVLVVGPNFGCGSSREHAVWGLAQLGIRAILGTSFASIFSDNCARNGILLVRLAAAEIEHVAMLCVNFTSSTLTVDLVSQVIVLADGTRMPFSTDSRVREDLLSGRDAVGATLLSSDEIEAFEAGHWAAAPWLRPRVVGS